MKNYVLTVFAFFVWTLSSQAQISESPQSMSQGVKNGFVLEIPNASSKVVEKTWKKFAKDYGKAKYERRTKETLIDNAVIPSIGGNNSIDVYTDIEETGNNVFFTTWFDLGGSYLNSYEHEDKAAEAQKILLSFGIEVAKEMTLIEIGEEEKNLKKLEQSLDKLKKDKKGYEKTIEDSKNRITKAEADIEQNIKDQENAVLLIEDQQKVLQKVKDKLSDLKN